MSPPIYTHTHTHQRHFIYSSYSQTGRVFSVSCFDCFLMKFSSLTNNALKYWKGCLISLTHNNQTNQHGWRHLFNQKRYSRSQWLYCLCVNSVTDHGLLSPSCSRESLSRIQSAVDNTVSLSSSSPGFRLQ